MTRCVKCGGSGHVCERCNAGIGICRCDEIHGLDLEEIAPCKRCDGTGLIKAPKSPLKANQWGVNAIA